MKKKLATVLVLVLLATAGAASAQENKDWTLTNIGDTHKIVLEAETPLEIIFEDDMPEGTVYAKATRSGCADVHIIIAPSEISEGISMNDLDEAGMEHFRSLCGAQYANPVFEERTTPSGNLYIEVCSGEQSDVDSFITLFEGYMIQLDYYHPDFKALTDADHAFAEEVLYGIWINEI